MPKGATAPLDSPDFKPRQQHGLRLIGRPAVRNRRRLNAKKEVGQASRYRPSRVKTFRPGQAPNTWQHRALCP